ncbi:MAG: alpha/beta fold hydrolase [Pseudomonadota bacterium]
MFLKKGLVLCALLWVVGCAGTQSVSLEDVVVPNGTRVENVSVASRGAKVPVTLVVPPSEQEQRLPLVVLIHGHGGTRNEAGSFATVANRLAANGIASIRMDFAGCGDSEESFTKNSLSTMLADIDAAERHAMRWAPIDASRVAMVGYSMGGRLAAMRAAAGAAASSSYKSIVMWAPSMANGATRSFEMMGGETRYRDMKALAARDGFVAYTTPWGQKQQLGLQWFEDLEASQPLDAIAGFGGALLLIHGSDDDVVPSEISTLTLNAALQADIAELAIIDGADHGFGLFSNEPNLSDQLTDKTVSFLISTL